MYDPLNRLVVSTFGSNRATMSMDGSKTIRTWTTEIAGAA